MFFGQLFERLKKTTNKKAEKKEVANPLTTSSSRTRIDQISPHSEENINPNKQLNKALNDINSAIQSNGANSHLLLEKAEILIQKEKYKHYLLFQKAISRSLVSCCNLNVEIQKLSYPSDTAGRHAYGAPSFGKRIHQEKAFP